MAGCARCDMMVTVTDASVSFFESLKQTMPRPTSDIWQYFSTVPSDTKVKKAKCSFCGHEQSSGVTRLAQHLIDKCQAIPHNLRDELRNKTDVKGKGTTGAPYQVHDAGGIEDALAMLAGSPHHGLSSVPSSTLHHPFTSSTSTQATPQQRFTVPSPSANPRMSTISAPMDRSDQTTMDWHLARAFYAAGIPFSAIEHPLLIEFFKRLRPGYTLPCKSRLQQHLLKTEHWDLLEYEEQKPDLMLENSGRRNDSRVGGASHGSSNGTGPGVAVSESEVDMDPTAIH
ncbi:hypothetical protein BC938DRAFT_477901 [Jimgerdemannia flammicorona]|uniref:BED-type domain-containing protein n=1 Tax=Jimgerdemannia flammicorona TaxID=994334 RepID=A0A433QNN9_9FUNG|nr:hypothetical protein BC938DRAFT_477901 [Jimgerdemannia flammicorona]